MKYYFGHKIDVRTIDIPAILQQRYNTETQIQKFRRTIEGLANMVGKQREQRYVVSTSPDITFPVRREYARF